ncbi:hypothetical protein cyc_07837 [Cyclospora cayetanensis]|uniref:Uncharacterized protein n=1 Tax=Cyclospora cayetanensis TaxID=88456 RepID=A0A1D3D613_9EIME|nr:hypothetical protein cyc_07837 [Cyclospora cayetanensis]
MAYNRSHSSETPSASDFSLLQGASQTPSPRKRATQRFPAPLGGAFSSPQQPQRPLRRKPPGECFRDSPGTGSQWRIEPQEGAVPLEGRISQDGSSHSSPPPPVSGGSGRSFAGSRHPESRQQEEIRPSPLLRPPTPSCHPYATAGRAPPRQWKGGHSAWSECCLGKASGKDAACRAEISASERRGERKQGCLREEEPSSQRGTFNDVSCSTTRSSSGSRYESRRCEAFQEEGKRGGDGLVGETSGETEAGHPGVNQACRGHKAGAPAHALSSVSAIPCAAADDDVSRMTESEVRIYARQLQALTKVLLCNMRCLYNTARAEIERKDQRITKQETELNLLKKMQQQQENSRGTLQYPNK